MMEENLNTKPGYEPREVGRLQGLLDGLQELFNAYPDPCISEAVMKIQTKLDRFIGFEGVDRARGARGNMPLDIRLNVFFDPCKLDGLLPLAANSSERK